MKRCVILLTLLFTLGYAGCSTSYKAQPVPFKAPSAHENVATVGDALVAAKAYGNVEEAKKAFGFDILGAGMLPVQVVIDNQGNHQLEINGIQTFLEDKQGNLWPILSTRIAYERATKYSKTKEIITEGASKGLLGAAAGTIIGAAIGIVTGDNVGAAAGKGAAAGAATGAVLGGIGGYNCVKARRTITTDFREKTLEKKTIGPKKLSPGILFFSGEGGSAKMFPL